MAVKWFCDQCGKELSIPGPDVYWTIKTPVGAANFCGEPCAFGWMLERETAKEEAEERLAEKVAATKKDILVEAVENILEACHDFLDEECEQGAG